MSELNKAVMILQRLIELCNSNYKIDSASISSSPFSGISHNSSNNKQNTDDNNNNNNSHQAAAALIDSIENCQINFKLFNE